MAKFSEIINSGKPVLVDFSAAWCGPCKMMNPILLEIANKMGDKAIILKVDVDEQPQAAAHYEVQSVPTLLLFKNGVIKWRQSGVVPATTLKRSFYKILKLTPKYLKIKNYSSWNSTNPSTPYPASVIWHLTLLQLQHKVL
ncbi:MAG: thioredoxin [Bacteroidetes bacterium]|nr:thioredoxin [Bacteroidota bacterium]